MNVPGTVDERLSWLDGRARVVPRDGEVRVRGVQLRDPGDVLPCGEGAVSMLLLHANRDTAVTYLALAGGRRRGVVAVGTDLLTGIFPGQVQRVAGLRERRRAVVRDGGTVAVGERGRVGVVLLAVSSLLMPLEG